MSKELDDFILSNRPSSGTGTSSLTDQQIDEMYELKTAGEEQLPVWPAAAQGAPEQTAEEKAKHKRVYAENEKPKAGA